MVKAIRELMAPNGTAIVGTLEANVTMWAGIDGVRLDHSAITYDHEGGTEVDWNDQQTVKVGGRTVFVDDDGDWWTEDQLVCVGAPIQEDARPILLPSYNELLRAWLAAEPVSTEYQHPALVVGEGV